MESPPLPSKYTSTPRRRNRLLRGEYDVSVASEDENQMKEKQKDYGGGFAKH
jgi:hypothetical protein